ncbi:hypothetical protein ANAEL_01547 [Anaerolineales bacterium]|nr:hypothetical protein ANAEL_01547 [Anaerolineales bacterium]
MKTLFRILVILTVAVLVGGLFYGAVTAASSGADQPTSFEHPTDGEFVPRDREEPDGIAFPADALKNLVIITVISALYLNVPKWLGRKKPKANLAS